MSHRFEAVAETGYMIAEAMQAELTLIHVITEPQYYTVEYAPFMGYQADYMPAAITDVGEIKSEAEHFLSAAAKHLRDTNIKTMVLEGEIVDVILKYITDSKADLLVMGSHRHKGLDRLLVPDVAMQMLKHVTIPMLTVPTGKI